MSRKKISFREKDVGGPPEHSAWVWHTHELKRSDAWRFMSPSLSRLLNELELEHMRHERRQNGKLLMPYADMMTKARISRGLITPAIAEGVRRGLLRVERDEEPWPRKTSGKWAPSRYRLTYLPTCAVDEKTKVETWSRPTDEWRSYIEPMRPKRESRSQKPSTRFGTGENVLTPPKLVPAPVPDPVLGEKPASLKSLKNRVPDSVPGTGTRSGTSLIESRGRGGAEAGAAAMPDPPTADGGLTTGASALDLTQPRRVRGALHSGSSTKRAKIRATSQLDLFAVEHSNDDLVQPAAWRVARR